MPVVKKANGWYWGSRGPFKTKAKALQIQRAAHASGYKSPHKKSNKRKKR